MIVALDWAYQYLLYSNAWNSVHDDIDIVNCKTCRQAFNCQTFGVIVKFYVQREQLKQKSYVCGIKAYYYYFHFSRCT